MCQWNLLESLLGNEVRMLVGGLAVLILLLSLVPAVAQDYIDLSQAISLALSQNKDLIRSVLSVDAGELRQADASAEFNTNIRPDAMTSFSQGQNLLRYGPRVSKKLEWGTLLNVSSGVVSDLTQGTNRVSVRFEIEQPIFRNFGSAIHREGILQANSAKQAARRKYELRKADIVLDVVKTYETILRLTQQVKADQESATRNNALYRVTKAKEGVGKTSRVDTLRVELLLGQAKLRLEASRERLGWAQRDFAELLGFPQGTVFEVRPAPVLELKIEDPARAIQVALANRLDYAQALQDQDDAARAVTIAEKKLMPDVRVVASYDDFASSPTAYGSIPLARQLWYFGLSSPTDYNFARERIGVEQAKVAQRTAFQTIDILSNSIAREVPQQLQAYRRAQAELTFAEQNFKLAQARAKLAKQRFALGRGDNFAVTDAEVAFLTAESALLSAQADASIGSYQLTRTLGTILEAPEDLKPPQFARAP